MSSIPTETRMYSGVTPVASCSPTVSCECVVDAGWITSVFVSATYELRAGLLPAANAEPEDRAGSAEEENRQS